MSGRARTQIAAAAQHDALAGQDCACKPRTKDRGGALQVCEREDQEAVPRFASL